MKPTITIFTPTFNRGYILNKCYDSLKEQTYKEFIWVIVDDGSIDNTENLVNEWVNEGVINIRYYKKLNGGKSSAHNLGVLKADTELFVCVDSDDFITSNAIEEIISFWERERNNRYSGIVALKGHEENKPLKSHIPANLKKSTLFDLYNKYGFKGDTMLIYRTEILKKHLFPDIKGEKFVPDAFIYDQIDCSYDLLMLNKVLYICEYLQDGYTRNFKKIIVENPKGYSLFYQQRMKISPTFYLKFRSATLYVLGNILAKNIKFIHNSSHKLITLMAIPAAILVYIFKYRCGRV